MRQPAFLQPARKRQLAILRTDPEIMRRFSEGRRSRGALECLRAARREPQGPAADSLKRDGLLFDSVRLDLGPVDIAGKECWGHWARLRADLQLQARGAAYHEQIPRLGQEPHLQYQIVSRPHCRARDAAARDRGAGGTKQKAQEARARGMTRNRGSLMQASSAQPGLGDNSRKREA